MLKTLALAGAATLLFAGAAAAQNMAATHDFLTKAGASDKYEVDAAKIAQSKGASPAVKRFARMMAKDHTVSTAKLAAAASADMGHPITPAMTTPEQDAMLAELQRTGPRTFDRTYIDQQTKAHETALELMKGYARTGDYPRTKAAARDISMTVQKHLAMARDLRSHLK